VGRVNVPSIRRWRINFKISELIVGELTNMREVHAKTTTCRKIRIVVGRRFRQFLLVAQLLLLIMAVHAQYRARAPLTGKISIATACIQSSWGSFQGIFLLNNMEMWLMGQHKNDSFASFMC